MGNVVTKYRMRNRKTPEHVRCTVIISLHSTEEVEIYHNSSAILGNIDESKHDEVSKEIPRASESSSLVSCSSSLVSSSRVEQVQEEVTSSDYIEGYNSSIIWGNIGESKHDEVSTPRASSPTLLSGEEEVTPFIYIDGYDHPISTESDRRYSFVPPPDHICACD